MTNLDASGEMFRKAWPWRLAVAAPLLVYVAAVSDFFVYSPHVRNDFPLDDAWIHQVYARSLAQGKGFAYNDFDQETGATSPLLGLVLHVGWRDPMWRRPVHWFLLAVPTAAWLSFCFVVNGHWFPNTFYAKAHPHSVGWKELGTASRVLFAHGWATTPVFSLGLVSLAFEIRQRRETRSVLACNFLVAPSLFLMGVMGSRYVREDGFYWTRWCDPATLVLTAACTIGFALLLSPQSALLARVRSWAGAGERIAHGVARVVVTGLVLASAVNLHTSYQERRQRLATDGRAIAQVNVQPALWIRHHTPTDAVIAVNDAGAFRYFGDRTTIDLLGLNNADITFGKTSRSSALESADWVAAFPGVYTHFGLDNDFEVRKTFEIPNEEYTPCSCPDQTTVIIAERRALTR